MDRGPWMQTFTGRAFYVLDPRPEDVEPEDIAHGLSFECLYNGQWHEFWSVAQHSICVAIEPRHPAVVFNAFLGVFLGALGKARDEANAYGNAQELRG